MQQIGNFKRWVLGSQTWGFTLPYVCPWCGTGLLIAKGKQYQIGCLGCGWQGMPHIKARTIAQALYKVKHRIKRALRYNYHVCSNRFDNNAVLPKCSTMCGTAYAGGGCHFIQ